MRGPSGEMYGKVSEWGRRRALRLLAILPSVFLSPRSGSCTGAQLPEVLSQLYRLPSPPPDI